MCNDSCAMVHLQWSVLPVMQMAVLLLVMMVAAKVHDYYGGSGACALANAIIKTHECCHRVGRRNRLFVEIGSDHNSNSASIHPIGLSGHTEGGGKALEVGRSYSKAQGWERHPAVMLCRQSCTQIGARPHLPSSPGAIRRGPASVQERTAAAPSPCARGGGRKLHRCLAGEKAVGKHAEP